MELLEIVKLWRPSDEGDDYSTGIGAFGKRCCACICVLMGLVQKIFLAVTIVVFLFYIKMVNACNGCYGCR